MRSFFARAVLLMLPLGSFCQEHLIAVRKDAKWGFVNVSGVYVIPSKFEQAYPFRNDKAVVVENGQHGVIDLRGKWIIPLRKGEINPEINSSRVVCANEKSMWGAMDLKGKTMVPFEYDIISSFQYHLAIAGKKSASPDLMRVVVMDTLGQSVISFDNIYLPTGAIQAGKRIREGYVSVLVDGDFASSLSPSPLKLGSRQLYLALLDIKGRRLVNLKINSLSDEVREGRFNLAVDGISYSWAVPLAAEPVPNEARFSVYSPHIFPFSSGIAAISKDDKWAFVDKDGSLLSETNLPLRDYTNPMPLYAGGLVIFRKSTGEGIFTDLRGMQRIGLEFEELEPFQFGAAVVKYKGKYGLIQKDGSWALPPEYEGIRF